MHFFNTKNSVISISATGTGESLDCELRRNIYGPYKQRMHACVSPSVSLFLWTCLPRSYCGGKDYRIMSINCLPGNEPTCSNNPFKPFTDDEEGLKKDKLCFGSHVTRATPTNKSQLHSVCC